MAVIVSCITITLFVMIAANLYVFCSLPTALDHVSGSAAEPLSIPFLLDNNPYEAEGEDLSNYKGEEGKRDLEQKQRLRRFCGRRKRKEPSNETLGHLYVFEKYKLIFCLVPKVASRQWISVLGRYRLRLNNSPYGPTVKQFPPEQAQKMLRTFYKFMFVREPFERLLSAYKDKFVHPRALTKILTSPCLGKRSLATTGIMLPRRHCRAVTA
ncbi:sulfotransferase 13 [Desmophyllum pertusum]|uniref:Carbohydrate sulfotransferase n=1 Tax=Desmophyllum pertusum TaxID=174260 RepID=A0A9X0D9T4_9CNID|nr:sulfotransferase 13 [Desmophyllum pertusum]